MLSKPLFHNLNQLNRGIVFLEFACAIREGRNFAELIPVQLKQLQIIMLPLQAFTVGTLLILMHPSFWSRENLIRGFLKARFNTNSSFEVRICTSDWDINIYDISRVLTQSHLCVSCCYHCSCWWWSWF